MNILVVCNYGLYADLSFSFVHNQIREYAALGHNVRVIIPNGVGKKGRNGSRFGAPVMCAVADGVQMCDVRYVTLSRFGNRYFNTASAIAAIRLHWTRLLDDFQPDVIHAHTLGFDSEIGFWLKKKLGCPLVVTTHGSDTYVPYGNGQKNVLKHYANQADTIVCVSSLLRRTLEDCQVDTDMKVILNGFNVSSSVIEEKEPNRVTQVGSLIPSKKTDITIRAISLLRGQEIAANLTVIGSGEELDNLKKLCSDLNMDEHVLFTGQLPNPQVHKHLAHSAYFVMPSVREGFGIVYLEAMAAGCITIGTEGEGIADLINHGENGFLVPADDPAAIARIITDCRANPEWAKKIALRGKEAALGLTWEKNAQQYLALFGELQK